MTLELYVRCDKCRDTELLSSEIQDDRYHGSFQVPFEWHFFFGVYLCPTCARGLKATITQDARHVKSLSRDA